jgi:hypothetical protein
LAIKQKFGYEKFWSNKFKNNMNIRNLKIEEVNGHSVGGLGSTIVVHLDGSQEPVPGSSPGGVRKLTNTKTH